MNFFRFLTSLLLLPALLLAGCGKDSATVESSNVFGGIRWQSFPVEVQLEPSLYQDAEFQADLQLASAYWESRAGKTLFVFRENSTPASQAFSGEILNPDFVHFNAIFFVSPWPLEPAVAGNTLVRSTDGKIEGGYIMLNGESSFCAGDCSGLTGLSRRKLIAHELGHFIGLDHSPIRDDMMFPEILAGAELDSLQVDVNQLQKLTN